MRRWPHPLCSPTPDPVPLGQTLYNICCALAYQTQLLAEIRDLLAERAADAGEAK